MSQTSWTSPRPSVHGADVLDDQVCGSRSISRRLIPPSMADRRQEDLVHPPAGQDLGEVGDGRAAPR